MNVAVLLSALVLALVPAALRGQTPEAVPADGKPFAAELAAADAEWQLTFRSGEKTQVMAAADLVRWGACPELRRGPVVVLADGSRLVAAVLSADKDRLLAESYTFSPQTAASRGLKLPLESVAGVVFQLPADRHQRGLLLDRVAAPAGQSDRLIMANGDEITGKVEGLTDDSVALVTDLGPVKVEVPRLRALIFKPALRRRPPHDGLHAWVGCADGSQLLVDRLAMDLKSLRLTLAGGLALEGEPRDLVYLQPLGGRATYLSDLEPAGYRFVPFLDLAWPYHADRSVTGGRLRAGGRLYLKGLGVHSAAGLMYKLDGSYRRFEAELAVDDSTGGRGSVRFRVFVDGRQQHASGPVRGGDPPVGVAVDLAGAKQLDLIVDYADRGDQQDHADWLDARLIK